MTVELILAGASVGFFLLAVVLFVLALCQAAARGDRMADAAREDVQERRIVAGGGFRTESRRRDGGAR